MARPTDKIRAVASINADGDQAKGRVYLVLVYNDDPDAHRAYRWYGTDDGCEWYDTETSADTFDEAIQAAQSAWRGIEWDLEWPHGVDF